MLVLAQFFEKIYFLGYIESEVECDVGLSGCKADLEPFKELLASFALIAVLAKTDHEVITPNLGLFTGDARHHF